MEKVQGSEYFLNALYISAYFDVAVVVSSVAAEARVHQDSIEHVDLGLAVGLRHEGTQV